VDVTKRRLASGPAGSGCGQWPDRLMEMLASQPPGSAAAGRRASRVRRCRRPVAGRARCHGYPNP